MSFIQALKDIFKNVRVIVLVIAVILAIVAIHPNFMADGVAIRSVATNSTASWAGISNPSAKSTPMSKEVILSLNNQRIYNEKDYYDLMLGFEPNKTIQIKTTESTYKLIVEPEYEQINTGETQITEVETSTIETIQIESEDFIPEDYYNEEGNLLGEIVENETGMYLTSEVIVIEEIETPVIIKNVIGAKDVGLSVYQAPTTNVRKGLDLSGGTRVLLQPERKVSVDEMDILLSNLKERLNVYGLTDIVVRETKDLPPPLGKGNQYIAVEIAGAKKEDVKDLLSKQGKFEAKIGNASVFKGGKDVTHVCRTADCSGLDPMRACGQAGNEESWVCFFRFSIALSPESAKRQADETAKLDIVVGEGNEEYLSEDLVLYLDDSEVDTLKIGASLRGRAATDIQISGSGVGATQQEAVIDTLASMKKLQTVLITGSLPIKLNIVKTDEISPVLGNEFVKNAILIAILAICAVALVVFIRYREWKVAVPMLFTMFSEVVLLLGLAALIQWNLDLAAIAGIIVAVGTGVDDQIVITDETLRGELKGSSWKERIKRAFFIIMGAYFTTVVAMLPLLFAGAGIIKGFALTTIIGVSIGVFITGPAYAAVVEILLKK
ncbi:hypothetical protein HOK51_06485 [Candidatus Woesearchaeota archaeon]|nr:hypothetical protein [Candidatus Woesearchaeota archaeon]